MEEEENQQSALLDTFFRGFDEMVQRMNSPQDGIATESLFNATSAELGESAAKFRLGQNQESANN